VQQTSTRFSIKLSSALLFNARSLNNKLPELHQLLFSYKCDLICITETWFHHDLADSVILGGSHYTVFRTDRSSAHHGGGVCILANYNKINVVSVPLLPCYSHLEICILDILSICPVILYRDCLCATGRRAATLSQQPFSIQEICVIVFSVCFLRMALLSYVATST
jgi:hypothetical protein